MRTVAQISDLHFGRTDAAMIRRVRERLKQIAPDVLVVSGDLTQRARHNEFIDARAFLETLPKPQIVVPGNHDIELYNPYGRFIERLQRYRHYISEDVEPQFEDAEVLILSVNTARSLTFKGGRINDEQIERLRRILRSARPDTIKILVAHHPLDLPEGMDHPLAGRARAAIKTLTAYGLDAILSGHLHISQLPAPAKRLRIGGHSALLIQAGTAISTRSRGEGNSFNVIQTERDRITVHQHCWSIERCDFTDVRTVRYERTQTGWGRVEP